MENRDKLISFITNNQKRNAENLLSDLRKESPCEGYAQARERILLIETAKELKRLIPDFYVDTEKLSYSLFQENISPEEIVDLFSSLVQESARQEKKYSYSKALDFINENILSNQLSVGGAADFAGLSQSGLVKLFTENMGMTPGDYIGKMRAEKSMDFLKENFPVEKTAERVGFSSVESYIRAFKKHMGMTPGNWKKKNL